MNDGVAIPLHLAVHVLGVAVAAGLVALGWTRREQFGPTWPGLVVGGGFLVVAHVLSGSLAVDQATVPLVLRAAGYAGIAVGAAGTVTSSALVLFVAPAPVHVAAALAGLAAAAAATLGRMRELSRVALLGGGVAAWALADGLGRVGPNVGAVVSVLGSVAVGGWVVVRVGSSLLARVLAGATALVAVTSIVLSSAGGLVFASDLEQDQLELLGSVATTQGERLGVEAPASLQALASALSGSALTRQVAADDGARQLDGRAQTMAELPGVDVAIILGPNGTVVGSWDVQAAVAGPLAPVDETATTGSLLAQQALTGVAGSGTVTTGDGRVLAVGATPIAPSDADGTRRLDRTVGALLLGTATTSAPALAEVAEQTGTDVVVLDRSARVVGTSEDALATPEVNAELVRVLATVGLPATAELGGTARFVATAPLGNAGTLVLTRPANVGGELRDAATRTLFLAALAGLALAAGLASVAARRVVEPVIALTGAAERLAAGDEDVDLPAAGEDEVGRLAAAFSTMVTAVADRELDLAEAADVEADLRRRLEIVTSSLSEALVVVDEHGTVTRANPAARRLLAVDDPVGQPVTRVLVGEDDAGRTLLAALADSEGKVVKATAGPDAVEVAATSAPLLDGRGRNLGRVHVLRDVTGEAQAERMKTEFLANISHELRTPLTPVKGYADVLGRRELDHDQVREMAARITEAAGRLERVIGMLVDHAAMEAGRLDVHVRPTSLRSVVDSAIAELGPAVDDRRVVVEVDPELPRVEVDPSLLRRQLVELVDNACKFSDDEVVVSAGRGPGRTVVVHVLDRGDGIGEEEAARVGEGFQQGDGSATRRHGGLGLGLSMVNRIADTVGTTVEVRPRTGGGTDASLTVRTVTT